jgi:hypothetical protein
LPVSKGGAGNTSCKYTFENAGVTTPTLFGFSTRKFQGLIKSTMVNINVSSSQLYSNFAYLILDSTLDKVQVIWKDGWSDDLTVFELIAYMNLRFSGVDVDGFFGSQIVIPGDEIQSIRVFSSTAFNVNTCVVSVDNK